MEKLRIPIGISSDRLLSVLSAWFRTAGESGEYSTSEVEKKTKEKKQTLQRQSPFLVQIGILEQVGSKYKLTDRGKQVTRYVEYEQWNDFKEVMNNLVFDWKESQVLFEYIHENEPIEITTLTKRIMMYSGRASSDTNVWMGANALLGILEKAEILQISESRVSLSDDFLRKRQGGVDDWGRSGFTKPEDKISITSIVIQNIKSLLKVEFPVKKMNILIGKNSSGKSSVLHALLALRCLKWGSTHASSSFHDFRWLHRKNAIGPMFLSLNGSVTNRNEITPFKFRVSFSITGSYCTQLCIYDGLDRLCDTSLFYRRQDLWIPFNQYDGLEELEELRDNMQEGLIQLSEMLEKYTDTDPASETSSDSNDEHNFSLMMDNKGSREQTYLPRRFLGAWTGILPEYLRETTMESLRLGYMVSRSGLSRFVDNIEFIPAVRGFFSIDYQQRDTPPERIPDDLSFVTYFLSKLIYSDHIVDDDLEDIKKWAAMFGIPGFEALVQPGPKVEGRGRIYDGNETLPVALYGFGSNQFLTVVGKCILAPRNAPILIEEPEIHLHPELQALSADFLIEMMQRGHQVFAATHSEHLIARIQRRIADGTITPDDVAILWIHLDDESQGTSIEEVNISDDGIIYGGLQTYLRFLESELVEIELARQAREQEEE